MATNESATALATPSAARHGAEVVRRTWIDSRTLDLVISSRAVGPDVPARLILPRGWSFARLAVLAARVASLLADVR